MFTPLNSILGATLIERATTSYLEEIGETIGLSSIIYNAVFRPSLKSIGLVSGMLVSTLVTKAFIPQFIPPAPHNIKLLVFAGTLVGFGTSWGSGCTSGHMLCGLSLRRWRSFVATVVFSATAMLVVALRPAPGCGGPCTNIEYPLINNSTIIVWAVAYLMSKIRLNAVSSAFKAGIEFGLGLFISGMADPLKPQRFLSLFNLKNFDPSLLAIVLMAIIPNALTWANKIKSKPIFNEEFDLPSKTEIPPKFILGNVLFGIGWGLCGICPGPGLINAFSSTGSFAWLAAFLGGSYVARNLL